MSKFVKLFVLSVSLAGLGGWGGNALAATRTSTTTGGNWNATTTWVGGVVPVAADNAIIATTGAGAVNVNVQADMVNLTVNSGSVLNVVGGGSNRIRPTGATLISGTLNIAGTSTSSSRFAGLVTVDATGVWTNSGNQAVTFRGGLTNNGTFTGGTGTQTFDTNSQVLGGASPINFGGIVAVSGAVTVTNNNTNVVTIAGNLTGSNASSTWVNGANSTLNYGGAAAPMGTRVFTASAVGNAVNYNGAAQTVDVPSGATYYHLTLSGSNTKTMPATALTISGNFAMSGTATTTAAAALTVGGNFTIGTGTTFNAGAFNHTVSGNWSETGTFTPSTGTVTLNGAAAQTISGTSPVNFNNLTVTNGASPNITLATNVTVASTLSGTVTLTSTCPTDYTLTSTTPNQTLHSCPTSVVNSIILANASPTSAATVSWTVTFNKSVTGVDNAAFSLVASGVSGAYITSVTGSGATWTVTANTGIGSGTLGLNQTGPGSVVPTLSGTFTGPVYTISATPALAEYRMDEASWNGTAGEVLDSSGTYPGQAMNAANTTGTAPAIAGNPGTCRYGVFDNGGTITQGYVALPGFPNLNTDFTITAWIRTTNNTVGAQRILIDDESNTGGYGLSLAEGGTGALRFYSRGSSVIILDTPLNTIANNTWYFVAGVADITNGMRRIYVYDATGSLLPGLPVSVASTGWGVDTGMASIGAETNLSGEPPAANHFKGNIDEVRVYQKVLNQAALAAIATQTHACLISVPDHLVIQSSGSGLTCAASTLTIVACANPACTTAYTGGVNGTLSATGASMTVNWDGTTGGATGSGFVIPAGLSSVTKNVQVATAGTVTFGVSSATPAPANGTICNFGNNAANDNCVFTANTAGFIFSNSSTGNTAYTIPSLTSGLAQNTNNLLWLRAVKTSTANAAVCTPAIISQTVSVDMGYTCNNPNTCQTGNLSVINGTPIASAGTAVSLVFDVDGSAPITSVRYDDVGQITLNANKTVTPFPGGTAITLNGSSNPFVVKPDHFDLTGIQQTAAPNLANPAAADATGNKFVKAGEPFSVTVTAKNALGGTTKNYGQETAKESVMLTAALAAGLTNNPGVSGIFGTFGNGVATADGITFLPDGVTRSTPFTWNEVGIITLTPSVAGGSYLGAGNVTGTASGNVGRFYPDHFDTTVAASRNCTGLTFATACPGNGLAYSGQQFSLNVYAMSVNGVHTQNYAYSATPANNFAKDVTLSAVASSGGAVSGAGSLTSGVLMASSSFGTTFGTTNKTAFTFSASPSGPTDIFVRAVDTDTVSSLRTIAANSVEGGLKVVSGRIKFSNAYGSELLPLSIATTLQYYNGTAWVIASNDSVSTFNSNLSPTGNIVATIINGLTSGVSVSSPGAVTFAKGLAAFKLARPGIPGSVDLTIPALSGINCDDVVPKPLGCFWPGAVGRATFGVYNRSNEIIYMRETY